MELHGFDLGVYRYHSTYTSDERPTPVGFAVHSTHQVPSTPSWVPGGLYRPTQCLRYVRY
eukprot:1826550-Rhodomonas_salina.3